MPAVLVKVNWWYVEEDREWVAVVPDFYGDDQLVVTHSRDGLDQAVSQLLRDQFDGAAVQTDWVQDLD